MLRKVKIGDIHSALLAYRATSLQSGFSPAELSMGQASYDSSDHNRAADSQLALLTDIPAERDAALWRSNRRNFN